MPSNILQNMLKQPLMQKGLNLKNAPSKLQQKTIQKAGAQPTGGEWTNNVDYDPNTEEMKIKFNSGFEATYPGVDNNTAIDIMKGATTKDGRPNSVGAALHRHPEVMRNYK